MSIALKDVFRTKDDSFDLTAFTHCLKEKSIDAPKVVMDRHGAIGRFRMCAGLMFRRRGRKEGFVVIDGNKIMAQREKGADGKHDSRSECRLERCLKMMPFFRDLSNSRPAVARSDIRITE